MTHNLNAKPVSEGEGKAFRADGTAHVQVWRHETAFWWGRKGRSSVGCRVGHCRKEAEQTAGEAGTSDHEELLGLL